MQSVLMELTLYNSQAVIHRSVFAVLALDGGSGGLRACSWPEAVETGQKEREAGLSWLERELAEPMRSCRTSSNHLIRAGLPLQGFRPV